MPIKVTCSNCGGVLHAPDDAGGKRGRCPTCGNILPIPAVEAGGPVPDVPAAPPGARPPSFADFAMGPQVGPPPGGSAADASRGSLGSFSPPPPAAPEPPKRATKPAEPKETRRATEPHARVAVPPPAGTGEPPTDGQVKAWKRCRGGFGLVNIGLFLLFIPAVLLPAYYTADAVMKATSTADPKPGLLPPKADGYLGLGVSSVVELPALLGGVPVLVGLVFFLLGRLSVAGGPKRSGVGGPAMLAAVASLLALLGAVAVLMPNAALKLGGGDLFPSGGVLFPWDSQAGMIQRFGLFFGLAAVVVGEFWFASAVGRVGSALADRPTCARSTRLQMLLGGAALFLMGTAAVAPAEAFGMCGGNYDSPAMVYPNQKVILTGEVKQLPPPGGPGGGGPRPAETNAEQQGPPTPPEFTDYSARRNREIQARGRVAQANVNPAYEVGRETNNLVGGLWERHVSPLLAQLGPWQGVVPSALFLLGGLLVWFLYLRACGAARRAIGGWLDAHGGV